MPNHGKIRSTGTYTLREPNFSMKKFFLHFIKASGNSQKMQEHLSSCSMQKEQETVIPFQNETEAPLKPIDLAQINYSIKQIGHVQEKADELKQEIEQDDNNCFTIKQSGKIISGQESAHSFNEECLGRISPIKRDILDALNRMQSLKDKHKRMYPAAKQNVTSRKRRKKRTRRASRKEHEKDFWYDNPSW